MYFPEALFSTGGGKGPGFDGIRRAPAGGLLEDPLIPLEAPLAGTVLLVIIGSLGAVEGGCPAAFSIAEELFRD